MPILRESLRDAATVQLRTDGHVGGNLLQRNRCWYFRDEGTVCWLKGGNRCFAIDGENRYHAVIGANECVSCRRPISSRRFSRMTPRSR